MAARIGTAALLALALSCPANLLAHDVDFALTNTGLDPDARARARFDDDEGRQRFEVKVEALAPGEYAVLVAGASAGTFEVESDGEGRFRAEGSPLGFDPRGQALAVASDPNGDVFFTASSFPSSRDEARARIKVREDFTNTGADADARGEARLRSRRGQTRFEVRVKDLPVGTYDLVVDGVAAADIEVEVDDEEGETEGKVRFDSRFARGNKRLLTFAPLCRSLAVAQGGMTFLAIDAFGASQVLCP
jgi:hypothetical protein